MKNVTSMSNALFLFARRKIRYKYKVSKRLDKKYDLISFVFSITSQLGGTHKIYLRTLGTMILKQLRETLRHALQIIHMIEKHYIVYTNP